VGRLRLATRAKAAQELHDIADRFRFLYGAEFAPSERTRALEARCRDYWEKRELIVGRLGTELEPEVEQRIQVDLLDLAVLGTDLRVRLAPAGQQAAAREEALRVLAQAKALFGPSTVLYRERQVRAEALGLTGMAREAERRGSERPPQTAWEHYALGRSLLRSGKVGEAAASFERALELQPHGLWFNFYQGICCYRLGRYEDAALAFTVCTTLAPEVAGCYFNRALAFARRGRSDLALLDFDHALRLDANLADAALNRGILHFREKRFAPAKADLERALESGADPGLVHYHLARVCLALEDRAAALAHLEQSLQHNAGSREARDLREELRKRW
jgi:tetratricopeptide (TPR) repeat protein